MVGLGKAIGVSGMGGSRGAGAEAEEGKTGAFVGSGAVGIGKVAEESKVGGKAVDVGSVAVAQ